VFPSDLPGVNPATLNGMVPYYHLMTKWSGLGDSTELSRVGLSQYQIQRTVRATSYPTIVQGHHSIGRDDRTVSRLETLVSGTSSLLDITVRFGLKISKSYPNVGEYKGSNGCHYCVLPLTITVGYRANEG
jgi:hypothetical protein